MMKLLIIIVVIFISIISKCDSFGFPIILNKRAALLSSSITLSSTKSIKSKKATLFASSSSSSSISLKNKNNNPINIIKRIIVSMISLVTTTIKYIMALILLPFKRKPTPKIDNNDDVESIDSVIAMAKQDTVNANVNVKQDELISVTIVTSDDIPEIPVLTSPSLSAAATEQNKKWVENKLKELKEQTPSTTTTSSSAIQTSSSSTQTSSDNNEATIILPNVNSESLVSSSSSSSSSSSLSSSEVEVVEDSASSLKEKIKSFGISGTISYILTELAFWAVSIPVIIYSYHSESGQWLDFSLEDDRVKIIGLSTAFLTAARLAVPFRLGVALSFTPFVEKNIINKFFKNNDDNSIKEKN